MPALVVLLGVCLGMLVVAGGAGAQAEVPDADAPMRQPRVFVDGDSAAVAESGAPGDASAKTPEGPSWFGRPAGIMVRSLVVPGWGQAANRRYWKAAVVAGVEGFLIFRAVEAGLNERDANDAAATATSEAVALQYEGLARGYNERRRDYTWWTIFAVILSMGDAYVDAHLGNFEAEFEPLDGTTGVRAAVRWNFAAP